MAAYPCLFLQNCDKLNKLPHMIEACNLQVCDKTGGNFHVWT